jgi:hypothetical protein
MTLVLSRLESLNRIDDKLAKEVDIARGRLRVGLMGKSDPNPNLTGPAPSAVVGLGVAAALAPYIDKELHERIPQPEFLEEVGETLDSIGSALDSVIPDWHVPGIAALGTMASKASEALSGRLDYGRAFADLAEGTAVVTFGGILGGAASFLLFGDPFSGKMAGGAIAGLFRRSDKKQRVQNEIDRYEKARVDAQGLTKIRQQETRDLLISRTEQASRELEDQILSIQGVKGSEFVSNLVDTCLVRTEAHLEDLNAILPRLPLYLKRPSRIADFLPIARGLVADARLKAIHGRTIEALQVLLLVNFRSLDYGYGGAEIDWADVGRRIDQWVEAYATYLREWRDETGVIIEEVVAEYKVAEENAIDDLKVFIEESKADVEQVRSDCEDKIREIKGI